MTTPITWQNVNGASPAEASRPMELATNSFNNAFSGLQGVIAKSETIDANNQVAIKNNNTQDYLNKLALLGKTPEALQQSIANGNIDKLKASYGNDINHEQVRGAAEGLLDARYKQVQTATDFGNSMLNEKTAPIMDKFKSAVQAKNPALIEQYRKEYSDAGGKHASDLEGFLRSNTHENQVWDEQAKGWVRDQGMHEAKLKDMTANQEINRGQLAVARQNASTNAAGVGIQREGLGLQKAQLYASLADKAEANVRSYNEQLGSMKSTTVSSPEGQAITQAALAKIADPRGRQQAAEVLANLPPGARATDAATAISSINQRWNRSDSHIRGEVMDVFNKLNTASTQGEAAGVKLLEARRQTALNGAARGIENSATYRSAIDAALGGKTVAVEAKGAKPSGVQVTPGAFQPGVAAKPAEAGYYGPNGWQAGADPGSTPAMASVPEGSVDVRNDTVVASLRKSLTASIKSKPDDAATIQKLGKALNDRLAQLQEKYGSRTNLITEDSQLQR